MLPFASKAQCNLNFEITKIRPTVKNAHNGSIDVKISGEGSFVIKLFRVEKADDIEVKSLVGNQPNTYTLSNVAQGRYLVTVEIPDENSFACRKRVSSEIELKSN